MRPQVLENIFKRTRFAFSGTPEQKDYVLKYILAENPATEEPKSKDQLPGSTIEAVKNYYLNNEISRSSPNMKDVIIVTKSGQKIKVGIKYLLNSIK